MGGICQDIQQRNEQQMQQQKEMQIEQQAGEVALSGAAGMKALQELECSYG